MIRINRFTLVENVGKLESKDIIEGEDGKLNLSLSFQAKKTSRITEVYLFGFRVIKFRKEQ